MKELLIIPLTSLFSILAAAGVLLHDTQLDKFTVKVFAPSALHSDAPAHHMGIGADHTHVERVSVRHMPHMARLQPRKDELREYMVKKNAFHGGHDLASVTY